MPDEQKDTTYEARLLKLVSPNISESSTQAVVHVPQRVEVVHRALALRATGVDFRIINRALRGESDPTPALTLAIKPMSTV